MSMLYRYTTAIRAPPHSEIETCLPAVIKTKKQTNESSKYAQRRPCGKNKKGKRAIYNNQKIYKTHRFVFSYLVRRHPRVLNNNKETQLELNLRLFHPHIYHNRLSLYLHLPWLLQRGRLTNRRGRRESSEVLEVQRERIIVFFSAVIIIDRVVLVFFFVSVCKPFSFPTPSTSPPPPPSRRSSGWIKIEAPSVEASL